ncbi:MAG: hypothetical protein WC340_15900 [Kiritimatiellia bacterium]
MSKRTIGSFSKAVLVRYLANRCFTVRVGELEMIEREVKLDTEQSKMDEALEKMQELHVTHPDFWKNSAKFERANKTFGKLLGLKS